MTVAMLVFIVAVLFWGISRAIDQAPTETVEVPIHKYHGYLLTFGGVCRVCELAKSAECHR